MVRSTISWSPSTSKSESETANDSPSTPAVLRDEPRQQVVERLLVAFQRRERGVGVLGDADALASRTCLRTRIQFSLAAVSGSV